MREAVPTTLRRPGLQRLAALVGLLTAAATAAWILLTHGRPQWALTYHVPLAGLLGCWLVRLASDVLRKEGYASLTVTVVGAAVVCGRMLQDWPASGHAVLASIVLLRGGWLWLRLGAVLILVQTIADKWIRGAQPLSALVGAALGLLLGLLAWRLEETRREDPARRQKRLETIS